MRPPSMAGTIDPEGPDDWRLATLAQGGDEDAYAVLVERHQHSIHAFVFRHISDQEVAADLTQEVFIRAWFALERVLPKAKFTTWLFQIAINLCRDHAKSKAARRDRVTDSMIRLDGEGVESAREFPDPSARPDQQAEWSETMDALDSEIAHLPIELREAFLLGAVQKLPQKEVAIMLGLSPKAVEVRIYRARQRLTERLVARGHIRSGN